MSEETKLGPCK